MSNTMAMAPSYRFTEIVADYLPDDSSQASLSVLAELEMQKLIKILAEPGNLEIDFSESDEPWSNGFSVCLDAKNGLGFDRSKLTVGLLYTAPGDLAAAWKDICKLPLSEWLLESKGSTYNPFRFDGMRLLVRNGNASFRCVLQA